MIALPTVDWSPSAGASWLAFFFLAVVVGAVLSARARRRREGA